MALLRGYVSGVGREKTIVPNYGNKKNDKTKYSLQSPSQTTWTGLTIKHQKINLF
ncbi:MAG TPA: hypothetical protein VIW25_14255 [Nitrososphaeraceae archaeon]